MKSKIKWEKVNIFLSIWASIATIISIILGYQVINNSKNNIVNGDNNGQMINTDSYYNQIFNNPQDYSENEILRQAEIAFDAKDYDAVRKLYTLDKVASNPIVFNNLGYMYANGLSVGRDLGISIHYYDLAIEKKINQAAINKFVALVNNIENQSDYVNTLYEYINISLKDKKHPLYKKFMEENNGIPVNSVGNYFINDYCDEWKDTGKRITVTDKPINTMFTLYYWISTNPTKTNGSYGQYQVWAEQKRHFKLKDYFNDVFIRI